MKIIHRIAYNRSKSGLSSSLCKLGISVSESSILSVFEISECDSRWEAVAALLETNKTSDFVWTEFSDDEKEAADRLMVRAEFFWDYPMPKKDYRYLGATYDLSSYDEETGMGVKQRAPFRMKSEPRWGKNHFLQLNWVHDAFFARPEIWAEFLKPMGIECEVVTHHSQGEPLDTVVQIQAQGNFDADLQMAGYACDGTKFHPVTRGYFPGPAVEPEKSWDYCVSREYFGSGALAFRAVIVSSAFYNVVRENELKGLEFIPMAK